MSRYVLGLSAFYHDSAAALLNDGDIIAAASEERFTRKKGDAGFPRHAVAYCLKQAGIGVRDLTAIGFYDKPLLKFERILETYLAVVPAGLRSFLKAGPLWIKDKLHIDRQLKDALDYSGEILYCEHHESHAASAFFPSPFEQAAILTMPLGLLMLLLPISVSGFGLPQGVFVWMLRPVGVPDEASFALSTLIIVTGLAGNIPGLALWLRPSTGNAVSTSRSRLE